MLADRGSLAMFAAIRRAEWQQPAWPLSTFFNFEMIGGNPRFVRSF
jgi:hypothetical protein